MSQEFPETIEKLSNKNKISADEFVKIVKDTFNIDNVIVHPPNSGPNKKPAIHSSSKFNMFEFEVDGRKYLILLSGGASANKGQDFEDKITLGLKDAIGLSIGDIEDEQIKQILNKLNINPQDLTKVDQTGGQDTKRTINPEAGPQDRGKTISDVTVIANNKPYYLSIKKHMPRICSLRFSMRENFKGVCNDSARCDFLNRNTCHDSARYDFLL